MFLLENTGSDIIESQWKTLDLTSVNHSGKLNKANY